MLNSSDWPRARPKTPALRHASIAHFHMFLADRLRNTVTSMGSGFRPVHEGELQDDTMDNIAMAGARFDWIQQRLRSA